jgi:hypothetical protein
VPSGKASAATAAATYLSSVSKKDRKNKLSILAHSISAALSHFVPQFPDPFLSFSSFESSLAIVAGYQLSSPVLLYGFWNLYNISEFREESVSSRSIKNSESKNMPRSCLFETHQRTRQGHVYLKPIKEHAKVTLI